MRIKRDSRFSSECYDVYLKCGLCLSDQLWNTFRTSYTMNNTVYDIVGLVHQNSLVAILEYWKWYGNGMEIV